MVEQISCLYARAEANFLGIVQPWVSEFSDLFHRRSDRLVNFLVQFLLCLRDRLNKVCAMPMTCCSNI